MKQKHYFAADGNFGDASGMVIMDTSKWTDEDWQRIEDASDDERAGVAAAIAKERN